MPPKLVRPGTPQLALREVWGLALNDVARVPVTLTGAWASAPKRQSRWQGTLTAPEPIVSVVIVADTRYMLWGKSAPVGQSVLPVAVRLYPRNYRQSLHDIYVSLSSNSRVPPSAVTQLFSATDLPALPESATIETGTFTRVSVVAGAPALELGLLLLARRDVIFTRHKYWRLRRRLSAELEREFSWMLNYGDGGGGLLARPADDQAGDGPGIIVKE